MTVERDKGIECVQRVFTNTQSALGMAIGLLPEVTGGYTRNEVVELIELLVVSLLAMYTVISEVYPEFLVGVTLGDLPSVVKDPLLKEYWITKDLRTVTHPKVSKGIEDWKSLLNYIKQ